MKKDDLAFGSRGWPEIFSNEISKPASKHSFSQSFRSRKDIPSTKGPPIVRRGGGRNLSRPGKLVKIQ